MDEIFDLIQKEEKRQNNQIQLIPSENFTSEAVLKALGSCLTNKYAEGYPRKRYYQGNEFVDGIEEIAIERTKKLFDLEHANVQPYSGSPANMAVLFGLLNSGDKIIGMKLSSGGHLTHGHPNITFSGKYFESVQYEVDENGKIDYGLLAEQVKREKPKLIFVGATAYPYKIDWQKFSEAADSVGAWLVADISHIAGLIVGGVHESPVPYVHIVTSTTHKTLRGPRGAFIGITKKGISFAESFGILDLGKVIDRAVFPGLQGGPHMNNIAGIAVAMGEADTPEFRKYAENVVKNAKVLAETLKKNGMKVYGTENHLMLVDVGGPVDSCAVRAGRGKEVAVELEKENIIVNANTIPHDTGSAFRPSGIRIGTPAMTTKGWGEKEFRDLGERLSRLLKR